MVSNIERVGIYTSFCGNYHDILRGKGASCYVCEIFVVWTVVELSNVRCLTRVLHRGG